MEGKTEFRRRYWIGLLLAGVVGGLVGLSISGLSERVFAVDATVKIGAIGIPPELIKASGETEIDSLTYLPVESAGDLVAVLRARYRMREAKLNQIPLPYLYSVSSGELPDILVFSTRGESIEQARELLLEVIDWVIRRHSERLKLVRENTVEYLEYFAQSVTHACASLETERLGGESGSVIAEESHRVALPCADLNKVLSASGVYSPINTRSSEIASPPVVKPDRTLNHSLVYALAGFVVGVIGFMTYGMFFLSLSFPQSRRES